VRDRFSPQVSTIRVVRWPVLATLFMALLQGCGFHPRGKVSLPHELSHTYLKGVADYSELGAILERRLEANGVHVVGDPKKATATILITQVRNGRRVISVNEKGKAQEFALFSQLAFEVLGKDKQVLLKRQTVSVTRDFIFDENDVLGKVAEANLVLKEMNKDLVRLMMFRLQTIGRT
jgi:LPS-assembly lipoprotein